MASRADGSRPALKARTRLGKYRILRRIGHGGFATVYEAFDTIEGLRVALKIPHAGHVTEETLKIFRQEARVHAGLDHPNVVPVKNAEIIDGHFVIAYPLGERSLAERMRRRISSETFLHIAGQMLEAVAYAHDCNVIHCDLKPENFLLFSEDRLRLADFSIARVSLRTMRGSGSGTLGYMAPDQAMGSTSFRSDVFSLGLIFWQMLSGALPEWPFAWPLVGHDRIRRRVPPEFVAFLRRALEVEPRKRFADAARMLAAYRKLEPKVRRFVRGARRRGAPAAGRKPTDWRKLRFSACLRTHRSALRLDRSCPRCEGPMSESMVSCPWCNARARCAKEPTTFPARCPRCKRGRKLDWRFCGSCYGAGFRDVSDRSYSDRRYESRCRSCRGQLLRFLRYCPWCRRKVRAPWRIEGVVDRCKKCGWGVLADYWKHCPWCSSRIQRK